MKIINFFKLAFALFFSLVLVSCDSDDNDGDGTTTTIVPVSIRFTSTDGENSTYEYTYDEKYPDKIKSCIVNEYGAENDLSAAIKHTYSISYDDAGKPKGLDITSNMPESNDHCTYEYISDTEIKETWDGIVYSIVIKTDSDGQMLSRTINSPGQVQSTNCIYSNNNIIENQYRVNAGNVEKHTYAYNTRNGIFKDVSTPQWLLTLHVRMAIGQTYNGRVRDEYDSQQTGKKEAYRYEYLEFRNGFPVRINMTDTSRPDYEGMYVITYKTVTLTADKD